MFPVLCLHPPPSPVPALYPEPSLEMLTVILGSLPWQGTMGWPLLLGLSHPCSLYYICSGDFRFPDQLGSLGVHAWASTAHWILTRDVWFYPSILLTALGDLNLFLLWWMLSLLGELWPYLSVKSASTPFGCAVAGVVLVCDGLVCNVLLLKWETNLRTVLNTVEEKAQITKFNGNPGFLMVTCCANSRFICFLINQKECSFYFSHLVESMLFSFLLLQIGATQEKGCFNFCFWLVFQGWVSIEHVKTYCIQLQSSALKDCKNLT